MGVILKGHANLYLFGGMMKGFCLLSFLMLLFSGCGGIVKKPAVFEVKKVAIVSMFSNPGVYNVSKAGGGISAFSVFGSFLGKDEEDDLSVAPILDFGGDRLISHALRSYEKELANVKGWQVVPSRRVIDRVAYKRFRSKVDKATRAIASIKPPEANWHAPRGMQPYLVKQNEKEGDPTISELSQLADKLRVDAVAVVQVDIGYAPFYAVGSPAPGTFGGTGNATASVASSVKIVTKTGKLAVITPDIERGRGERARSEDKVALIAGNIPFNDRVEAMFREAIEKNASIIREKINKELN